MELLILPGGKTQEQGNAAVAFAELLAMTLESPNVYSTALTLAVALSLSFFLSPPSEKNSVAMVFSKTTHLCPLLYSPPTTPICLNLVAAMMMLVSFKRPLLVTMETIRLYFILLWGLL